MSAAAELSPDELSIYTMQDQPKLVAQIEIRGEQRHLTTALSRFPHIGESIFVCMKDGTTEVLKVVNIVHWGVEMCIGQTSIGKGDHQKFVDACLVCDVVTLDSTIRLDKMTDAVS